MEVVGVCGDDDDDVLRWLARMATQTLLLLFYIVSCCLDVCRRRSSCYIKGGWRGIIEQCVCACMYMCA